MKREDVVQVDELKIQLSKAFQQFERQLTGVFGEMVYAVDTVIDHYNALDTKQAQLEARLDAVTERLLALERLRGEH